jgi:hypothetical protein
MPVTKSTALCLVLGLLVLQSATTPKTSFSAVQDPAPLLKWQDWQLVGTCGGADYWAVVSVDDGRNDQELRLKIDNKNAHAIQTRLNAVVESADGERRSRHNVGVGRLNGQRTAEACSSTPSLCFGVLFRSGVLQKEPTRIAKLSLTKVEIANIDAPPANAPPGAYLDPFRDFPTKTCRNLSITFDSGGTPAFIKLTDECVKALPRWTKPECDDAVDEIVKAHARATNVNEQSCIKEWREYQKCYEIYAYDSNPVQRPSCSRPACRVKG